MRVCLVLFVLILIIWEVQCFLPWGAIRKSGAPAPALSSSLTWNDVSRPSTGSRRNATSSFQRSIMEDSTMTQAHPSSTGEVLSPRVTRPSFSYPVLQEEDTSPLSSSSTTTPPASSSPQGLLFQSPITTFATFRDYLCTLEHEEDLVVVLYAASFCKLCQRATMVYKQLAGKAAGGGDRPSPSPSPKFYRLEVEPTSAQFMRDLGITKFPYIQIFYQTDCVASFSTGPSHLFRKKVEETVRDCVNRTPEQWRQIQAQFRSEIQENHRNRKHLLLQEQQEQQVMAC